MAKEIQLAHSATGATLYALIWNTAGQVWNGTTFVTYATADLGNYDVAMTEQGTASRFYAGDFPAVALGIYGVTVYVRAGASPAEGDTLAGAGEIEWDGSAVAFLGGTQSLVLTNLNATVSSRATVTALAAVAADLPQRITKNVALSAFMFFMRDTTDHVSGKTGLTVTATRSLDGAAFASCTNSVTEVSNGWYKIDLAAGDLNGNVVALKFTATGADATNVTIVTQPT